MSRPLGILSILLSGVCLCGCTTPHRQVRSLPLSTIINQAELQYAYGHHTFRTRSRQVHLTVRIPENSLYFSDWLAWLESSTRRARILADARAAGMNTRLWQNSWRQAFAKAGLDYSDAEAGLWGESREASTESRGDEALTRSEEARSDSRQEADDASLQSGDVAGGLQDENAAGALQGEDAAATDRSRDKAAGARSTENVSSIADDADDASLRQDEAMADLQQRDAAAGTKTKTETAGQRDADDRSILADKDFSGSLAAIRHEGAVRGKALASSDQSRMQGAGFSWNQASPRITKRGRDSEVLTGETAYYILKVHNPTGLPLELVEIEDRLNPLLIPFTNRVSAFPRRELELEFKNQILKINVAGGMHPHSVITLTVPCRVRAQPPQP